MYSLCWERDPDFPRKDLTKDQKDRSYFVISCLCRDIKNAVACAEWYFVKTFGLAGSLRFTDGRLQATRCKIDSRNFTCHYLMLDGMKEPFDLIDAKSNYNRFHKIFL